MQWRHKAQEAKLITPHFSAYLACMSIQKATSPPTSRAGWARSWPSGSWRTCPMAKRDLELTCPALPGHVGLRLLHMKAPER